MIKIFKYVLCFFGFHRWMIVEKQRGIAGKLKCSRCNAEVKGVKWPIKPKLEETKIYMEFRI